MNRPAAQRDRLSDHPRDFGAAVQQVSTELGIGESLIEKDHWVCEALRAVEAAAPGAVVFKGGTSLEKLRLINRFSEDLDLLVVADYPSKNAADVGLKNLCSAAAAAIPGATPTKVGGGGVHPRWLHRAVSLSLPNPSAAPDGLAAPDTVLLELGQAGGRNPASRRFVTSLLSRHARLLGIADNEFDDIGAFEVTVLHPGRTLIEKLLRVNNFALDEQRRVGTHGWSRIGRQFYDLWALLGDDEVREFLARPEEARAIRLDCQAVSAAVFRPDLDPPGGGFAASAAFDSTSALSIRLHREHDTAMERFYYGTGPAPTYDQVIERVRQSADLLNI